MSEYYHILLARGPGPDSDFIELEDDDGHGMGGFDWQTREGGIAVLVLPTHEADLAALKVDVARLTRERDKAEAERDDARLRVDSLEAILISVRMQVREAEAERDALRRRIEEGRTARWCYVCDQGWGDSSEPTDAPDEDCPRCQHTRSRGRFVEEVT